MYTVGKCRERGVPNILDFKQLQKEYGGRFVAILQEETVVASGNTFNEVICKLQGMKIVNKAGLSIRFIRPVSDGKWRM